MLIFDPTAYGPVFAPLLAEERLNALGPGSPDGNAAAALGGLSVERAFAPGEVKDRRMANACLAGIWLYYDHLDESHRLSQSIATATGSFWHSLMHRREPDGWNSKYWLDRVGRHPVFPALCGAAGALAEQAAPLAETRFLREQQQWDPYRFVDLCESARLGKVPAEDLCRRIQLQEWRLLFDYCYRQALGSDTATSR
jgi:hypothetical protein